MKNPRRPMGLVPHLSMHREPSLQVLAPKKADMPPTINSYMPLVLTPAAAVPGQMLGLCPDGRFKINGAYATDQEALAWLKAWAKVETAAFLQANPDQALLIAAQAQEQS